MNRSQLVHLFCLLFSVSGLPYQTRPVYDKSHPELGNLFQGDIILAEGRNALLVKEYLWPNGVIPYVFHSNYTEDEKAKVKAGMKGIEDKTCVKFVPHTSEADYIEIRKATELGCGAMVGRRPGQGLPMAVNYRAPECLQTTGIIQHELLHVLGLFHEQSRPDRDEYVTVLWDNITPEFKLNFAKAPNDVATTYNVPYDYKSLMHYHNTAYSKNGKNTIIAKNNTSLELGQVIGPTEGDLEKIRKLYNCTCIQKRSKWPHLGLLNAIATKSVKL